ncbi:MAG TPA: 7TM-DISM domain-containing protein [Cyclobacteriaceae bacterium]|nr:7TM-DISM domain-containing protein [Cyclobacteriaceae bacterium]
MRISILRVRNTQLLIVCLLVGISFQSFSAKPKSEKGLINLHGFNLAKEKIALDGFWYFTDNQLYSEQTLRIHQLTLVEFPQLFNQIRASKSGLGYGNYSLQVVLPANTKDIAFELPQIYCAYELWINNSLIAKNGVVGTTREETIPQWLPQIVSYVPQSDTLRIQLVVANFHHNLGGVRESIFIAGPDKIIGQSGWTELSIILEFLVLMLITILALLFYFLRSKRRVVFYFAILALAWGVRAVFSNQYLVIQYFPQFDWNLMIHIEYISLYVTMIYAILFLGRVFGEEDNRIVKYFFVGGNLFFIGFTIILSPLHFTLLLPAYMVMSALALIYAAFVIIRALLNEREGAGYIMIVIFLGIFLFGYDILSYQGLFVYNLQVLSYGYISIFLLLGMSLLYHLQIIKGNRTRNIMTFEDYYKSKK